MAVGRLQAESKDDENPVDADITMVCKKWGRHQGWMNVYRPVGSNHAEPRAHNGPTLPRVMLADMAGLYRLFSYVLRSSHHLRRNNKGEKTATAAGCLASRCGAAMHATIESMVNNMECSRPACEGTRYALEEIALAAKLVQRALETAPAIQAIGGPWWSYISYIPQSCRVMWKKAYGAVLMF